MSRLKRIFSHGLHWVLYGCGLFFILIFAVRIFEEFRYGHLLPPRDVKNIHDFRKWRPDSREATVVTFHGSTYYAIRGPYTRALASGPSEYYFDHNGNYVGRNPDTGDVYEPAIFSAKDAERKSIDIDRIPAKSP